MRRLFACLFVFLLFFFPGCADDVVDEQEADAGPFGEANSCKVHPSGCKKLEANAPLPAEIKECLYIDSSGTYDGDFVNIGEGGALYIDDAPDIDVKIRVKSLLVEYGGVLQAGTDTCQFGRQRGKLTVGLWGNDPTEEGTKTNLGPNDGITCMKGSGHSKCFPDNAVPSMKTGGPPENPTFSPGTYCAGTSPTKQDAGGLDSFDTCIAKTKEEVNVTGSELVHGADRKNFLLEHYENPPFDQHPFGYKTLAVSYGGSIRLFGARGVKEDQTALNGAGGHCAVATPKTKPDGKELDKAEMERWAQLSGTSWARLAKHAVTSEGTWLTLDRALDKDDWLVGDRIVVGTTDWYPSHNESREILEVDTSHEAETNGFTMLKIAPLRWKHTDKIFDITDNKATFTGDPKRTAVDMRAPVGLLTRSITIKSLGKDKNTPFKTPTECAIGNAQDPSCYFGGHVMFRQGFRDVQISGVEFYQLGQGGRQGHYPVHFHMAKSTAYTNGRAFVKDSSIWDSMTRFAVLHGTQGVTLARNVGWLSTGHGFMGEDSSEIENKFCHNLALEARAPLVQYYEGQKALLTDDDATKRKASPEAQLATARWIPPILKGSSENRDIVHPPPVSEIGSDARMPSMFWVMNAYNEFVGNQVSGVHGFGSCYWLLGSAITGMSKFDHQFDGIAKSNTGDSMAPLQRFRGNACSTSTYSLLAAADVPPDRAPTGYTEVVNPYAGRGPIDVPIVTGTFRPIAPGAKQKSCAATAEVGKDSLELNADSCVTTVIDRYTTSFNWAQVNYSAIWLRPGWYLVTNSAVTDQLGAGLTFVSAGSWIQVAPTYFSLVENSLFVGTTQFGKEASAWAKRSGPMLKVTAKDLEGDALYRPCVMGNNITCNILEEGIGVFRNELNPKRLLNIYDGPAYAKGNTFVRVGSWKCDPMICSRKPGTCLDKLPCASDGPDAAGCVKELPCGIYGFTNQPHPNDNVADPPADDDTHDMVVADAAIGWKQPNGFYYPPAFAHEDEIFYKDPPPIAGVEGKTNGLDQCWVVGADGKTFDMKKGDCRHNAVDRMRTYTFGIPDNLKGDPAYRRPNESRNGLRLDVNPIDFQTILVDIDGTLTGATATLKSDTEVLLGQPTMSVSRNTFFDAPKQTDECLSFGVQTSPYQYVSTMIGKVKASPTSGVPSSLAGIDDDWGAFIAQTPQGPVLNPGNPMVGIYRQWKLANDSAKCENVCDTNAPGKYGCTRASFMMGPNVGQAVHLTMSPPRGMPTVGGAGFYYIDTGSEDQLTECLQNKTATNKPAKFKKNASYAIYNLFPRNDTKISYTVYVGVGADPAAVAPKLVRVNPHRKPVGAPDYDSLVEFECDASAAGACGKYVDYSQLASKGLITVTLDHSRMADKFLASARTSKEQCMTRDLCKWDNGKCASCVKADGTWNSSCLKATHEGYLGPDATALAKTIDDYCLWSMRSTGTATAKAGELSLTDCPESGCLGFVFTLPDSWAKQSYANVFPTQDNTTCFSADWNENALVERPDPLAPPPMGDAGVPLIDPTCGKQTSTVTLCKP